MASDFAVSLGYRDRDHPLSLQWYANFMSRWPDLKVLKPRGLQIQRAKATSIDNVNRYFVELEAILKKYDLMDKPERIYNVDEKGISTTHKPPSVVCETGTKPPSVTSGSRTNVTVLGCGNALGNQVPPYFIFPGVRMRSELLEGKTVGADGTVTQSGWSNAEVFQEYLRSHLLKYLPDRSPECPVLLMYDGHKSHISVSLIDWAKQENIILFILPAHTSHVLQPMDIGCFGPFESIYNAVAHKYMRENCGASITRNNICPIACKAYSKALSPDNLQNSFKKAGIYPFNPKVVEASCFLPSTVLEQEKSVTPEATSDDISPADQEPCQTYAAADPVPLSDNLNKNYFEIKEQEIKKKKTETNKRQYLSYIVSGKAITEDNVVERITEHQENVSKKSKISKSNSKSKQKVSKASKKSVVKSKPKSPKGKKTTKVETSPLPCPSSMNASPQPGPSHINLLGSESDSTLSAEDDEVCCVCNKFTPDAIRYAVSLVFVKWAECDALNCGHWTHLGFCTETRVVRKGDKFFCPHCKEE